MLPNINTARNPQLSLTRNDGPDLRGGQEAFEELDAMGALPVRVKVAYDRACAERAEIARKQNAVSSGRAVEPDLPDVRIERMGPASVEGASALRGTGSSYGESSRIERFLVSFARERDSFSREEVQEALGVGRDAALKVINGMVDEGALVKTGRARATRYRASERVRRGDSATG